MIELIWPVSTRGRKSALLSLRVVLEATVWLYDSSACQANSGSVPIVGLGTKNVTAVLSVSSFMAAEAAGGISTLGAPAPTKSRLPN